jgi:hypothetical protein
MNVIIKLKAEKRQTVVERIDTTSHSTHGDREAPQEALKPLLFSRTSLKKKER